MRLGGVVAGSEHAGRPSSVLFKKRRQWQAEVGRAASNVSNNMIFLNISTNPKANMMTDRHVSSGFLYSLLNSSWKCLQKLAIIPTALYQLVS